jgi:hypothetical protein
LQLHKPQTLFTQCLKEQLGISLAGLGNLDAGAVTMDG